MFVLNIRNDAEVNRFKEASDIVQKPLARFAIPKDSIIFSVLISNLILMQNNRIMAPVIEL
jgi:hypothetical protein